MANRPNIDPRKGAKVPKDPDIHISDPDIKLPSRGVRGSAFAYKMGVPPHARRAEQERPPKRRSS
jgi:hypothetical protein